MESDLLNIDLNASLKTERVILKSDRFDLYMAYFSGIVFGFLIFVFAIKAYQYSLFLGLPFLLILIWMIFNMFLLNKLVKIDLSKFKIEQLIQRLIFEYPELKIADDNEQKIIQLYKVNGFFCQTNSLHFVR